MAEEDPGQEKTEEPTSRRLEKAKEDGQVARSKELNTTVILLAGTLGIYMFGYNGAQSLFAAFKHSFSLRREDIFTTDTMLAFLGKSLLDVGLNFFPIFLILMLAGIVAPLIVGGWLFSAKSLMPKFNRMNPISGIGKMFSKNALVELFKSWVKVLVVGALSVILLYNLQHEIYSFSQEPLRQGIIHGISILLFSAIMLAASTILIAMIDVPFQIYTHMQKLKMTFQQVKDEYKDTDGKPEVKQRIRQLQYEMSQRRMMSDVPTADVVITNPTHYSIAIKYDSVDGGAPKVVAKGIDQVAFKIREIAYEHNVMVLESPALARSIYHTTKIGQDIPEGLYHAVAIILAYVYQIKNFRPGKGMQMPKLSKDIVVPEELRYNE